MANAKIEKGPEILMYSQLQPWNAVRIKPCMEQIVDPLPVKVGEFCKIPRPHPWRPALGYELVEATPLPELPITNLLVDACRTPSGMITEPLKFPNLITGFDRNASHAARAALYTRYTPCDWMQNQIRAYNEANENRKYSESLRTDTICLMK